MEPNETEVETKVEYTELEALNDSIKIWRYLADSGDMEKSDYPDSGWISQFECECPLCEYSAQRSWMNHHNGLLHCMESCPLARGRQLCECELNREHPYLKWKEAETRGQKARYAEEMVDLLVSLRDQLPREEWIDITTDCQVQMVKSGSSDGYYGAVLYHGRRIAALGVGRFCHPQGTEGKFKLVKAKGATVSFRVMMKVGPYGPDKA